MFRISAEEWMRRHLEQVKKGGKIKLSPKYAEKLMEQARQLDKKEAEKIKKKPETGGKRKPIKLKPRYPKRSGPSVKEQVVRQRKKRAVSVPSRRVSTRQRPTSIRKSIVRGSKRVVPRLIPKHRKP